MALTLFNPAPLPNPPAAWDPQYMRQVIRVLELYFNQLESGTPNYADSYTAKIAFYGTVVLPGFTSAEITALPLPPDGGVLLYDKTLHKLKIFNGTVWQTVTSV